jgi:hypothetical protein
MVYQPGAQALVGTVDIGTTVSYVQFTANVTISGTTEGTATNIVSAATFVPDGSTYFVEFYSPQVIPANADFIVFCLYDNSAFVDRIANYSSVTNVNQPLTCKRRVTPTLVPHLYEVRGFRGATNGTVGAGAGGTGVLAPGFILITKVAN